MSIRVLHLVAGNLFGGVETCLLTYARRRAQCPGLDHHFGVCYHGRLSRELEALGAPVHCLGRARTSRPWSVVRARRALAELAAANQFDVAICHTSWPYAMFAPVVRRAGVRLVYFLHGAVRRVSWLDRWARWTRPDLLIAVSDDTRRTSHKLFACVPTEVLYHPLPRDTVNGDDIQPARANAASVRKNLNAAEDDVILLQASRMEPGKGHAQLIEALARLHTRCPWRCWIAGGSQKSVESRYRKNLERQVEQAGLASRVQFLGERSDVPMLLAAADVLCQANTGPEGFSLAFMEAFAAGLPIVTTRLGGAPELIDSTSGILTPPGDVAALTAALGRLIDDADLRRAMGRAAVARVSEVCDPQARLNDLHRTLAGLCDRV